MIRQLVDYFDILALEYGAVDCSDADSENGDWFLFRFPNEVGVDDVKMSFTAPRFAIALAADFARQTGFELSMWRKGDDIPARPAKRRFGFQASDCQN